MLNIAIDSWHYEKSKWHDRYGAKYFMQEYFKQHGINLARCSFHNYNGEKKCFNWYDKVTIKWVHKHINKPFYPDIIWNRKNSWTAYKYDLLASHTITPCKKIADIWNDKYENYLFLKEYQPTTFLLSTFFRNKDAQTILWDKIVVKPIRSNWWRWILLTDIPALIKDRQHYLWLEDLYIVQSFKDFSWWYLWLVEWNHDIRCMFAWKNIIETTLRIPKKWDFRSNIGSWWKQKFISNSKIPPLLKHIIHDIYTRLNIQDTNIFSMDFAYCKKENKRYLLEINTSPGTRYYQTNKKHLQSICTWLLNFFLSLSKDI